MRRHIDTEQLGFDSLLQDLELLHARPRNDHSRQVRDRATGQCIQSGYKSLLPHENSEARYPASTIVVGHRQKAT